MNFEIVILISLITSTYQIKVIEHFISYKVAEAILLLIPYRRQPCKCSLFVLLSLRLLLVGYSINAFFKLHLISFVVWTNCEKNQVK